jgi:molecular chaperone Hsp33
MSHKGQDRIEKFLQVDGLIRASAIIATDVVEEMRGILKSQDLATVTLGRSMIGALLMASHLKKGENVGIYFRGNGPLGAIFAEGDHSGATRAYTPFPQAELPLKNNKPDIGGGIGIGIMEVVRSSSYNDALNRGAVEIQTGQVGDDIAYYLFQSHQIPSVVALSVELNSDGSVKAAGGVLVELLPEKKNSGPSEEIVKTLEAKVAANTKAKTKSLGEMIANGATPLDLVNQFLSDFKIVQIAHKAEVKYQCRCSEEKAKRALFLLGHEELDELLKDSQETHDLNCDFCGRKYTLTIGEIQKLRDKAFKNSLN